MVCTLVNVFYLDESPLFWKYLVMCLETPRPSGHLDKIRARLLGVAKDLGLESEVDKIGNVMIRKPAGAGFEDKPSVCVQCHIDMVASANIDFDFENSPIDAYVDGEWLKARDTTLGADDGAGIAGCLALLEESSPLPALECLFTVEEETDMSGAEFIAGPPFVQSEYLINVDSEEMHAICVGCAGGFEKSLHLPITREVIPPSHTLVHVHVTDGVGGHSGVDIHKEHANAIKVLMRVLDHAHTAELDMRLVKLDAGQAVNSIPRSGGAVVAVKDMGSLEKAVNTVFADIQHEYKTSDGAIRVSVTKDEGSYRDACAAACTRKVIDFSQTLPHGVQRMSTAVTGDVDTSVAFTIARLEETGFYAKLFCRSSSETHMANERRIYESLARLAGATCSEDECPFPGWEPDMASLPLQKLRESHKRLFGTDARVYSIHAGLECGAFKIAYPKLDCASIGPLIEGAHSPDERLHIPSAGPFYTWLLDTLKSF
ncbi:hypothetical protein SARC_01959 [Sphaeroforma arctica JP610]|uniref:Peptidase M20 dimerisation domain-containing protein n=1 Tax=Sphaeroforma arctica JP610 TaxID=667725 RepID=A0A0L0GC91_9EUKA|nr:hypothetical protein SARC_01959 [Sphaeroforma arctica JP610]KNC85883.1 hypothetical protein SARC_01959 [Sphaeroforma arctica JP610]|eukprot:XP_014159785.1 hypothetical protein SARC_01959 [Sphaeroforma arctica JP610]